MKNNKKGGFRQSAIQENIFCFCVLILFFIQFIVFWVYANINNIALAFQTYIPGTAQNPGYFRFFTWEEGIFSSFAEFFGNIFSGNERYGLGAIANGAYFHILSSFVCLPFSYMIAFILYKKLPATGFFKVVLYLPAILSGMVTIWLYRHMLESGLGGESGFVKQVLGMQFPKVFTEPTYNRFVVSLYVVFFGLPGSLLVNLGSMSRVPHELVEYGELEGISLWKEFCLITVPMIFPVLQVQCLGLFTGFFTAQGPLYVLYGQDETGACANLATFGYNMFRDIAGGPEGDAAKLRFSYNSAAGLTIGLISIPIVQLTKALFDKLDPGAEF